MPILELPDGKKLTYREEGDGPPLVLVHGSPGEGRSWSRVIPHLKDRFRVISPDLPGYGKSDELPENAESRTAAMASSVVRLIQACGSPVVLAGHSFGGNVAAHAALQAPHGTVDRLVLLEPVFFRAIDLVGNSTMLAPAAAFFEDYASRALAGEPDAVRLMIDFWFGADAWDRMPQAMRDFLSAAAARNALDVRGSFREKVSMEHLASFQRPVLVAYGSLSPPIVAAIIEALAKLMPLARPWVIDGATHGMLDSHAPEVAGLIAGDLGQSAPEPLGP